MQRAVAIGVAQEVLVWLTGQEDLVPVFLNATGNDAASVRAGARDPAFLGSVLDFVMMDDAWIVSFCDASGHPYEAVGAARRALPGGEEVHWT